MAVLIDKTDNGVARMAAQDHGNDPSALIEILHAVQATEGFVSETALRTIADALNISRAEAHGVSTFYHDFRREPPARHRVQLCRAEACQAVGSEELAAHAETVLGVKTGDKTPGNAVRLEAVYCLGNCALGPAAMVDGELKGRVTTQSFDILAAKFKGA